MGWHIVNRAGRPGPVQVDRGPRMGQSWYSITNRVVDMDGAKKKRCATIRLYDEIGMWGTTAADFVRELDSLEDVDEIELLINSPGGDVFDGLTIFNTLVNHPATVRGRVDGLAASAASFIAMACDELEMGRGSMMMIHDAAGFAMGSASEMRSMADLLDKISDQIAGIYAARTGVDVAKWRAAMLAETWYTDSEAVEAGLAGRTAETQDDEATDRATAWAKTKFPNAPAKALLATGGVVPAGGAPVVEPGSPAYVVPQAQVVQAEPVVAEATEAAADPEPAEASPEPLVPLVEQVADVEAADDAACSCSCDSCVDSDCGSCTDQCEECVDGDCTCTDDDEEEGEEEESEPTDTALGDLISSAFGEALTALTGHTQTPAATEPPASSTSRTTTTADAWDDLVARLVGPPSPHTADDVLTAMRGALL